MLVALGAVLAAACTRPSPRVLPTSDSGALPQLATWTAEAQGILAGAREVLAVFDDYAAFRATLPPNGGDRRSRLELDWDPPSPAAWQAANDSLPALARRSAALLQSIATPPASDSAWRERRALADAAHLLVRLVGDLSAYRRRIDVLGPGGDGSGAYPLLRDAWDGWTEAAARWQVSPGEAVGCA